MKTLIAIAIAGAASMARAQSSDPEAWARDVVDSPYATSGDVDARAAVWLARIESEPSHPLVEATLRAFGDVELTDPEPLVRRLLALDGARMLPVAAAELESLQSRYRAARTPLERLESASTRDLHRGVLARCDVLGPLADPFDRAARARLVAEPGLDRAHRGLRGLEIAWQPLERPAAAPWFDLDTAVAPAGGWALAAFRFDVPRGGAGFVEVDATASRGPLALAHALADGDSIWWSVTADPSFAFSLDGAPPVEVDLLTRERSLVQREPVVFREGRNVLTIAAEMGAGLRFAVRVLDERGQPWSGLAEASDVRLLGRAVRAQPPSAAIPTSESYLTALRARGPDTQALLGLILIRDGRASEGLAFLRAAVDAAPDRLGLAALLSNLYPRAAHLPESFRRARSREIAERVVAAIPEHAPMQASIARTLAPEDREEEAIATLEELASRYPALASAELDLASVHARLDLDVLAERAVLDALQRAPRWPRALDRAVELWEGVGQPTRALELREQAMASGRTAEALRNLGSAREDVGACDASIASYRAAAALAGSVEAERALAERLVRAGRAAEADPIFARLSERFAHSTRDLSRRADIAHERGDAAAERELLRAALAREPSHPVVRERLRALGEPDPAREFQARESVDVAAELQAFDASQWSDSVVRAVDAAAVWVFDDGAFEQLTQARLVVRDLDGCEREGKQRPQGDTLRIATIKAADGSEHEPVLIDGEFVMPSLEPGDSIELVQRAFSGPRDDGVVRAGRWNFASVDEPFHVSRYAISIPKHLGLRMVLRNFDGEHSVRDEGEREVHVFEVRDRERVVLDPGAPPADWILAWVEFGTDVERDTVAALLARSVAPSPRVTPEIAEAAARAIDGVRGDEARARALHAFTGKALDKPSSSFGSATAALVTREGNASFLYAALLDAAGIDHELVWSRGIDPNGDPEPEPAFTDAARWWRKLLVLVRPSDGPPSWCDMSSRTLPYGILIADAPGASALATRSREWLATPEVALEERPGEEQSLSIALDAGRGAQVELTIRPTGNVGYAVEEPLRELPAAQLKRVITRVASTAVPGIDVTSYDLPGLDDEASPVRYHVVGTVKSFLDESGGELACKLPFPALQLGRMASGEGERRHPFFLQSSVVRRATARFELPEGLRLVEPPQSVREEFHGARFELEYTPDGERAFTLRRELVMPPLVLALADYPGLVAFAKRVDDADRTRLRFTR